MEMDCKNLSKVLYLRDGGDLGVSVLEVAGKKMSHGAERACFRGAPFFGSRRMASFRNVPFEKLRFLGSGRDA